MGIAIDSSGAAYLTGLTFDATTDFPTTVGAFDIAHNGGADVFVAKLNPAGSALTYSTFLGGSGDDVGYWIAVDTSGAAYITGETLDATTDFPVTAGAFDTVHNGGIDAFALKLNPAGSALTYSTFLGGSGGDAAYWIAIDSSGAAYLTGVTDDGTTDFPVTGGAFDTTHNGVTDAFAVEAQSRRLCTHLLDLPRWLRCRRGVRHYGRSVGRRLPHGLDHRRYDRLSGHRRCLRYHRTTATATGSP